MESKANHIIIVGAGLTVGPLIEYLLGDSSNKILLLDSSSASISKLCAQFSAHLNRMEAQIFRVESSDSIRKVLSQQQCDLIISMLPPTMHHFVVEAAIEHRVNALTPSYNSAQMEALRSKAEENNVLVVTEMGLDPGIDIMISAKMINEIRIQGGNVKSYVSLCGAIPAPAFADAPLGYKFSWSPRGVLLAATRSSRFKAGGKWRDIPGPFLCHFATSLASSLFPMDLPQLCWIPNGDAQKYSTLYQLPSDETDCVVRGTLRYPAFGHCICAFQALGLLDETVPRPELLRVNLGGEDEDDEAVMDFFGKAMNWKDFIREALLLEILQVKQAITNEELFEEHLSTFLFNKLQATERELRERYPATFKTIEEELGNFLPQSSTEGTLAISKPQVDEIVKTMAKLGMLGSERVPRTSSGFAMDSLCAQLQKYMNYGHNEFDIVAMIHRINFTAGKGDSDDGRGETKTISAKVTRTGDPKGWSATAWTVGVPVGATAQLMLDGGLGTAKGFLHPSNPLIYKPVLAKLESFGLHTEVSVE